jgi:signal transduction histidine kinase
LPFLPNTGWYRYLSGVRLGLGCGALGLMYLAGDRPSYLVTVCGVLFVVYSIVVALRLKGLAGAPGMSVLLADTAYFLVLGVFGSDPLVWLESAFILFLLTETLVFFTSMETVVVAGICAAFSLLVPVGPIRRISTTVLVSGVMSWGFAMSRQRQRRLVEQLNTKVTEAEKAADKARENERQRIASDFHDGPLQDFISLQMRLDVLRKVLERDSQAGMDDLRQLQTLAQGQVRDLRAFLHSMRPVDVDGANLVATARRAVESFQKESGIPVTFLGGNTAVGLPQEMSLEVLQMLRESLHNVQKHAGATRVAVAMEKTDRCLEISVEDNGHGFPFAGTYSLDELELLRLGPASLKRRAKSLNAELLLESRPGRGAGVKFRIPLQ